MSAINENPGAVVAAAGARNALSWTGRAKRTPCERG
jgi:hypothetical protein